MTEDFKSYCLKTLISEDEKLDPKLIENFAFLSVAKEPFPIPIGNLVEWGLDTQKSHAVARLEKSFILGTDFYRTFDKSTGGRPKKCINLSVNCFRTLCAQAQNEKGKMLLRYLLLVERLWKEYMQVKFDSVQDQLRKEQDQLKDEIKNHRDLQTKYTRAYGRRYHTKIGNRGPTFYVITSGLEYADGMPRVKIGVSGCKTRDPNAIESQTLDKRLANHRVLWSTLRVNFLVYAEDALTLETMMKRIYRAKTNFSHEMIEGVPVEQVIQTCKSILQLFDMNEEISTFKIEKRLNLFNSEENDQILDPIPVLNSQPPNKINMIIIPVNQTEERENNIEINHTEFPRSQIQSFLNDIQKLNVNELKNLCRKFKLLIYKRNKIVLREQLQQLFQKALGELSENTQEGKKDENKAPEPITGSYDPENLPRGISFIRKNGSTLGLKLTVGLGGSVYASTFRDGTKSMSDRFQEALQLQQDMVSEFNLTGSVNWENYKRQQIVRLGICVDCGKDVSKTSSLCQSCSSKHDSAAPPKDRLLAMLREHKGNLSAVGRDLNRTDVAVRKWLVGYGFTKEEIKKRSFL